MKTLTVFLREDSSIEFQEMESWAYAEILPGESISYDDLMELFDLAVEEV